MEARKNKNLVALGVNCINPDYVADLFINVQQKIPLVVSFKKVNESQL